MRVRRHSKEDSSFSEEKEAKRLSIHLRRGWVVQRGSNGEKFFGSFFQKRTACL
jgi:hypothetical protein